MAVLPNGQHYPQHPPRPTLAVQVQEAEQRTTKWKIHELEELTKRAKRLPEMTLEEYRAQRRSFAYGQFAMSHPEMTGAEIVKLIDEAEVALIAAGLIT